MRRFPRVFLMFGILGAGGWFVAGCSEGDSAVTPPGPGPEAPTRARADEYLAAKRDARRWLDTLEVDLVELQRNGVKGKKKLAEILDAYLVFWTHAEDPEQQRAIRARAATLAVQTAGPDYHNLAYCPLPELRQNSMSYLRVYVLMDRFGLDIADYLEQIRQVQGVLDEHVATRGPWQRAMFAAYYDRIGLDKPSVLQAGYNMADGVIARRLSVDAFDPDGKAHDRYSLTHEVFVAFDYGWRRSPKGLTADDLTYLRRVLPELLRRSIREDDPDLAAELISCMTYVGLSGDPAYQPGLGFLLNNRNVNGSWGRYESERRAFGRHLDQARVLHTTLVASRALMEAYQGGWSASGDASDSDR